MRILILTRTNWLEPPRLRHQLSLLLASEGHQVYFVQKPTCLLPPSSSEHSSSSGVDGLTLLNSSEFVNHQLRFLPILHQLNAFWARYSLVKTLNTVDLLCPDLIVNFNYDAFWLRSIFPDQFITSIINDDFEALSRFPVYRHLTWAFKRTCVMSDHVLAVSEPLLHRIAEFCEPELFLPWASEPYQSPSTSYCRNVLLYWGYINHRLDFTLLRKCVSQLSEIGVRLRFVGPIDSQGSMVQRLLASSSNVEWLPASSFSKLNTEDCFAALLPYRLDYPPNLATQLPNKALQLLSRGLPLISSELPYLHRASFVIPYDSTSPSSLITACLTVHMNFYSLQPAIAEFLSSNGPGARLSQLFAKVI